MYVLDNEEIYINDLSCEPAKYPNLEQLFDFLTKEQSNSQNDDSPNPTAANYFYMIAETLISCHQVKVLSFVYSHKHILKVLVDRADVSAYRTLLKTIVHFFKDDEKIDAAFKFLKYRFTLLKRMFEALIENAQKEQSLEFGEREKRIMKERNLVALLSELIRSKDKIVDAEYFLDQVLLEKSNMRRLRDAYVRSQSPELLGLIKLLMGHLFDVSVKNNVRKIEAGNEAQKKFEKLKNEVIAEDIQLELPDVHARGGRENNTFQRPDPLTSISLPKDRKGCQEQFEIEITAEDGGDQSPDFKGKLRLPLTPDDIQTPPRSDNPEDSETEANEHGDNKSTAETSNGPCFNIEIEMFDNQELVKNQMAQIFTSLIEHCLELLISDKDATGSRFTSTRGTDAVQTTGLHRIGLVRFIATGIELSKIEDCISNMFGTEEVILGLFAMFDQHPTNNVFHLELTRLLETVIGHFLLHDPKSPLLDLSCDRIASLSAKFNKDASKSVKINYLYKQSMVRLAELFKLAYDSSGSLKLSPASSWPQLESLLEQETRHQENKLFQPMLKFDLPIFSALPQTFELSNSKIDKIIAKKEKSLITDEESPERSPKDYQSNRNDLNMEMLNQLLLNLETDASEEISTNTLEENFQAYSESLETVRPRREAGGLEKLQNEGDDEPMNDSNTPCLDLDDLARRDSIESSEGDCDVVIDPNQ